LHVCPSRFIICGEHKAVLFTLPRASRAFPKRRKSEMMNYPAARYGVSEGRCFAWLSMTRSTKLRVMVREIEPRQTNVILRLKADESLFKSAASCVELDPSD